MSPPLRNAPSCRRPRPEQPATWLLWIRRSLNNTNRLRLFVFGNEQSGEARLIAIYDNLGKGASGAAVQNLNLMLGLPETAGLV